ncbi:MAG: hypothetical protein QM778_38600 [Myxococcales bacterium]
MRWLYAATVVGVAVLGACGSDGPHSLDPDPEPPRDAAVQDSPGTDGDTPDAARPKAETDAGAPQPNPYAFAGGCYTLGTNGSYLVTQSHGGYAFATSTASAAARFYLKAADLGTYLLYDHEKGYVTGKELSLVRTTSLESDISLLDDTFVSPAEWQVLPRASSPAEFSVQHKQSARFLGAQGLVLAESEAAPIRFEAATGCSEHPELSLDARGSVGRTKFDDGTLYGIVDAHSHVLSNFGFGGGGIFHGAPFHRLGVEHALGSCEPFHGEMGRKDFFGYGFDRGPEGFKANTLLPVLFGGQLGRDNHHTAGYPDFTDWPNGPFSSTHQTQYYVWLQRAWLSGLRLEILHATTNQIICDFTVGQGYQDVRYSCNDMVAVDRILREARNMERYIDAQAGGPGRGFFRIVETPTAARKVIADGKLAVVLGIETSNLFDCFSVPHSGAPKCDPAYVRETLDDYYALGVRAMFPVHKYDNAFSAGDGHRGFIELGNFVNSGQYSNFVESCPDAVPTVFDSGNVEFGGLNKPRDRYDAPPPNDMSKFAKQPMLTLTEHSPRLIGAPLKGNYCQKTGLTALGETLMREMMARGMIIELDHLPRRGYQRAFELLEEHDYPAAGTHGTHYDGRLYALGGISRMNFGRCRDPQLKGAMLKPLLERVALQKKYGGYGAEGLGLDLNGFAGAPKPRFGERAGCQAVQADRVTYPFKSYTGDVEFTQPKVGERTLDFNTEGLVHIGLLPELIEDARGDANSDADLEPLFRSAEGYLRMWERAEERAKQLREGG